MYIIMHDDTTFIPYWINTSLNVSVSSSSSHVLRESRVKYVITVLILQSNLNIPEEISMKCFLTTGVGAEYLLTTYHTNTTYPNRWKKARKWMPAALVEYENKEL